MEIHVGVTSLENFRGAPNVQTYLKGGKNSHFFSQPSSSVDGLLATATKGPEVHLKAIFISSEINMFLNQTNKMFFFSKLLYKEFFFIMLTRIKI